MKPTVVKSRRCGEGDHKGHAETGGYKNMDEVSKNVQKENWQKERACAG